MTWSSPMTEDLMRWSSASSRVPGVWGPRAPSGVRSAMAHTLPRWEGGADPPGSRCAPGNPARFEVSCDLGRGPLHLDPARAGGRFEVKRDLRRGPLHLDPARGWGRVEVKYDL